MDVQLLQWHLLKRPFFLYWILFAPLWKVSWVYLCRSVGLTLSSLSCSANLRVCPSTMPHHIGYCCNLTLGSVTPPTLFFFSKIILTVSLCFFFQIYNIIMAYSLCCTFHSRTSLSCNWKCVPSDHLCPFPPPLTLASGNHLYVLYIYQFFFLFHM